MGKDELGIEWCVRRQGEEGATVLTMFALQYIYEEFKFLDYMKEGMKTPKVKKGRWWITTK